MNDPVLRLAPLCTLLATLAFPPAALASGTACPMNLVAAGCGTALGYIVATADYGIDEVAWSSGQSCQRACYDLRAGHLVVRVLGQGCIAYLDLTDTFRIEGSPAGTVHSFFAELHLTGESAVPGMLRATIGGTTFDDYTYPPSDSRILVAPLTRVAGEPFDLGMQLQLVGLAGTVTPTSVEGRVYFRGLPQGVNVRSCQSYNVAVPVRPSTWGALKSAYR